MPPKKRSKTDQDATEIVSWTNDEVELVPSNSSEKDYERLEWESVKSKYHDIRKDFEELYRQGDGERSLPHDVALFTRERIETYGKCKKSRLILVGEVRSKADKYPDTLNTCLHDKTSRIQNLRRHDQTETFLFRIRPPVCKQQNESGTKTCRIRHESGKFCPV